MSSDLEPTNLPSSNQVILYEEVPHQYSTYMLSSVPSNTVGRVGDILDVHGAYWYYAKSGWSPIATESSVQHPVFGGQWQIENGRWMEEFAHVGKKRVRLSEASDTSSGKRDTIASGWLTDVQKDWSLWAHGIDSRLYITGCEILEALHKIPGLCDSPAYGSCLVILGPAQCGPIRPSLKLLLVDLLNDSDFIACEFLTGEPVAEMPLLDFLANIYQPLLRNIQTDAGRMYGALNIPVSDMGLGLCLFEATPYSKDPMCVVDDSDWLTVWTSPGAITHPHMDHCGATQYFIHLFGHKIWLTWPPTERNLEFFGHLHRQRAYPDRMKKCLENLEGLQVFLANKPNTAFVLKPNTIHGCISISGSGHSGIRVWSLDHWKTSCRLMKWVIEWLYRQLGGPHTITEIVFDIEKLKDEIDQWKKIADKAGETHDKVHGMLQEIWAIETDVVHLDNVVNSMLTAENILAKHTVA